MGQPVEAGTMSSALVRPRLPHWSFAGIAAGVIAATVVLFAATPLQGRIGFLLVAAGLYVLAQTVASVAV